MPSSDAVQVAGAVNGVLVDSVTFLVSAARLLGLRPEPEPRHPAVDRPGMLRQIAGGIAFITHGPLMKAILVVAAMTNFAMLGITAPRVVYLVRTDGAAPGTVGLVIGLGSLGGVIGAALASRASRRFDSARTYLVANVAVAPFALLLPLGGVTLFAIGSFIVVAGAAVANAMTMTFRGKFVPAHLLGRVIAASRLFVFGSIPLGAVTSGLLASALGIRAAMWVLAVVYAMTPLPLLATSCQRRAVDVPSVANEPRPPSSIPCRLSLPTFARDT